MTTAKDPVCGMTVDTETAKYKSEYEGKPYYFCNVACKSTFDQNPAKYAAGSPGKHSGGCCCCGGH